MPARAKRGQARLRAARHRPFACLIIHEAAKGVDLPGVQQTPARGQVVHALNGVPGAIALRQPEGLVEAEVGLVEGTRLLHVAHEEGAE